MLIREMLRSSGLPMLESEILLAHVLHKPRTWLLSHDDEPLPPAAVTECATLVARRKAGEPVAYITGEKEFFGRTFYVTCDVLIPRPATEELVVSALDFLKRPRLIEREIDAGISALCVPLAAGTPELVVDIGTGSGCIAATLALEGRTEQILAIDLSKAALDVATENFSRLAPEIKSAVGDGPAFVSAVRIPFVVISNPPYIPEGTPLPTDVADHEPHDALFAGKNGLDVLAQLARAAAENPACLGIALELQTDQLAIVKRLLGVM